MKRVVKLRSLIDDNKPFLIVQEEAKGYLVKNEEDDQSLKRYIRLAEEYISKEEYAVGINLLRMYYDEYPAIQVAFKLAESYYLNKQLEEAKYWIERTKSDELRYKVGLLEARILFEEKNWEASEQILEQICQKFQHKDAAIEMLGDVASAQGYYKKAQRAYLELFNKSSRNVNLRDLCLKLLKNEGKVNYLNDEQLLEVIRRFRSKDEQLDIKICKAYFHKNQYQESFIYCQSILHQGVRHPYLYILHDYLAYRLNHRQLFSKTLLSYLQELSVSSKEYLFLLETLKEVELLNETSIDLIHQRFLEEGLGANQVQIGEYLLDYYFKYHQYDLAKELLTVLQVEEAFQPLAAYFKGRLYELEKNWQLAAFHYDEASKALVSKLDVIKRLASCYIYHENYYLAWSVLEQYQNSIYAYDDIHEDIERLKTFAKTTI
ncbi:tetratricopeptide repeat protein [Dolosicoccus paucivorans]